MARISDQDRLLDREQARRLDAESLASLSPRSERAFSTPKLRVIENPASHERVPQPTARLAGRMPWTGFYRLLHPENSQSRDPAQRQIEEKWAALFRGDRLARGNPLRELYGFSVAVPGRSASLIGSGGIGLDEVRKDVAQYSRLLVSMLQSRPEVPPDALRLLNTFRDGLRSSPRASMLLAQGLGVPPQLFRGGIVTGAGVTPSLGGAVQLVLDQVQNGN